VVIFLRISEALYRCRYVSLSGGIGRPDGQVLRETLERVGVPVVSGVPVGHGLRNDPVTLGGMARVAARGREGVLRLGRGVWGE
jgi:hypothetical protein